MLLGTYPITDPVWIVRLKEAMKAAFLKRPAQEWEKLFMANKITVCMSCVSAWFAGFCLSMFFS